MFIAPFKPEAKTPSGNRFMTAEEERLALIS